MKADEEALPSVVCPVTVNVPFEVREEVAVISPPVSELIVEESAERMVVKKLAEVSEDTVVVAKVDVPSTVRRPDVVALPLPSVVNALLGVHEEPFQ